jgi:hypothetical protein
MAHHHWNRSIAAILCVLPLFACQSPQAISSPPATAIAQASEQRTVVDYFLEAPERYFKALDRDSVTVETRQKLLKKQLRTIAPTIDIPNGYISTPTIYPDVCASYEMAIFRRSRGSHLVALNVSCTMGDQVVILDPDRAWADVTAAVMPVDLPVDPDHSVDLPRQGRTIVVSDYGGKDGKKRTMTEIEFEGDRFRVVEGGR